MKFIQTSDRGLAAAALRTRLESELQAGKKVLWLISGGSNIAITVAVMHVLTDAVTTNLTVMLVDERHGLEKHDNSNQQQLMIAGFDQKQATLINMLEGDKDLEATRTVFDAAARQAFTDADIVIGQLGIGNDGHIAGILPASEATASADFVTAYTTEVFNRITLTSHALKRLNAAYVYAFGGDKLDTLHTLQDELLPYEQQPAQILKELPEVYIFNDAIGDTL